MRLSKEEIKTIKKVIENKDEHARIYLFGSRVDDSKKGGDIDILIFSQKLNKNDARDIKYSLWEYLGEQKIDIVIAKDKKDPFVRIALKEAIKL